MDKKIKTKKMNGIWNLIDLLSKKVSKQIKQIETILRNAKKSVKVIGSATLNMTIQQIMMNHTAKLLKRGIDLKGVHATLVHNRAWTPNKGLWGFIPIPTHQR